MWVSTSTSGAGRLPSSDWQPAVDAARAASITRAFAVKKRDMVMGRVWVVRRVS